MFVNRPLLPTCDRQHHQVDHLANRGRVVLAKAVLDEQQDAIVRDGTTAVTQNLARLCVVPVMNDVLHHKGARS